MDGCNFPERDFKFWFPLELKKGNKANEVRIGGVATDEDSPDLQGETVFVKGLDISYLASRGTFNWDHGKGPADILGEVDIAQKTDGERKLYVEGFLYPDVEKAQDIVKLMGSMEKAESNRRLGMSLEGKIKERDGDNGKIIKKAWIKNVAVTYHPINQGTYLDFIKSLGNQPTYEPCTCECGTDACPFAKSGCGAPGEGGSGTTAGMYAGADNPSSSGGVSGSALRKESLEKDEKVTTYTDEDLKKKKKTNGEITKGNLEEILMEKGYSESLANRMTGLLFNVAKSKKTLSKSDVISLLRDRKGYSDEAATRMTDILFSLVKGNVYIPDHYRTINGERKLIKGFNQTRQLKDLDKAEKRKGHIAYQKRSKSGKMSQVQQKGIVGEPYRTKGSKNKPEEKKAEGKEPEKVVKESPGELGWGKEKDTKFWETWHKQYSDPEMQKYLNDEGKARFAELDKKYGEETLSKEEIAKLVSLGGKPEEMEWITKNPALAKHIIKFGEKEKETSGVKVVESPKSGTEEIKKEKKEWPIKGLATGKETPKKEKKPVEKKAPVEKKEEPVSMEIKAEGKPPEKKVGSETQGEAEWEVSESKAGAHAKEFYSSGGMLMSDKYHAIAQNYPNATPEESQMMIEVLKYGLAQYKEMYVEKKDWGEKGSDPKWLQTNKLVGAEEGKRRAIMKRAEGHPAGSKDQRQDYRISLNIQERIPKLVLGI